ncbi:MAG: single-stranded DNA-binding protein [Candidatus Marinimicrobia bacterium]|jgi:single-strand DNA-binding protein|nr:single-stranded DNA-binding protein [Candidatus Neomarinimicrobiota bacterium]MBT3997694.1 single-stranded DNA-binding protein [Candidatus Neomarinimicrobiota bacterium]MBT4570329.1 single-stranded DNA-binding protein [Candidatus Neomarinimicrobiota bacterium]MBT5340268.1 single-stranded DNA-binding protein [Candidatus Neomarinimicrobiota bacterium]MBT6000960.1 single-stranded DNA-binding protein [Candidatus Neomarinimicrobiota bacterium]
MKSSLNRIILIGELERNPESRYTPEGTAVLRFTLSTHETRRKQDGETYDWTEWHKVVVFDILAEKVGPTLKRGQTVHVDGHIRARSWKTKDGFQHTLTEIIANQVFIFEKSEEIKDISDPKKQSDDQEELPF